jgi:hypothetical protein
LTVFTENYLNPFSESHVAIYHDVHLFRCLRHSHLHSSMVTMTKRKKLTQDEDEDYAPETAEHDSSKKRRITRARSTLEETNAEEIDVANEKIDIDIFKHYGIDQRTIDCITSMSHGDDEERVNLRPDALVFTALIMKEYVQHLKSLNEENSEEMKKLPARMKQITSYFAKNKDAILATTDLAKMMGTNNNQYLRNIIYKARKQKILALAEPLWNKETPNSIKPVIFRYVGHSSANSWEPVVSEHNFDKVAKYIQQHGSITMERTAELLSITLRQARFFFTHFTSRPEQSRKLFVRSKLEDDIVFGCTESNISDEDSDESEYFNSQQ